MRWWALLLVGLNFADAYFTARGLASGRISEGNPAAAWLLGVAPPVAAGYKLVAVPGLILALASVGPRPWLRRIVLALVILYAAVLTLHARWLLSTS